MEGMTSIPPAMLEFPAAMPPDGVVPQYVNPPSYGYQLVASTSVLLAIMILFLINRIYVKLFIVRDWSWDDITCGISALLTTAYYAVAVYEVRYCYLGVHFWNLKLGEFMQDKVLITDYLMEVLSSPTLGIIKLTFFLLFLQIFSPTRSMRWACYIGFICTFLVYSGFTVAWFVIGTPGPGVTWQAQFMGPTQKGNALDYPMPVMGLIFDIYILILPLVGVSKLQLSFRRKMGVVLIFTTAILWVSLPCLNHLVETDFLIVLSLLLFYVSCTRFRLQRTSRATSPTISWSSTSQCKLVSPFCLFQFNMAQVSLK